MGYRFKVEKGEVFNKIYNLSQFNPGQLRLFNNLFMLMRGFVLDTNSNITDFFIKVDGVFKLKPFTLKKPTFVI